jgi:hypothetical protein
VQCGGTLDGHPVTGFASRCLSFFSLCIAIGWPVAASTFGLSTEFLARLVTIKAHLEPDQAIVNCARTDAARFSAHPNVDEIVMKPVVNGAWVGIRLGDSLERQ